MSQEMSQAGDVFRSTNTDYVDCMTQCTRTLTTVGTVSGTEEVRSSGGGEEEKATRAEDGGQVHKPTVMVRARLCDCGRKL